MGGSGPAEQCIRPRFGTLGDKCLGLWARVRADFRTPAVAFAPRHSQNAPGLHAPLAARAWGSGRSRPSASPIDFVDAVSDRLWTQPKIDRSHLAHSLSIDRAAAGAPHTTTHTHTQTHTHTTHTHGRKHIACRISSILGPALPRAATTRGRSRPSLNRGHVPTHSYLSID